MSNSVALKDIMEEIREKTSTSNLIAINRSDEVKVMQAMINDPDFTVGIYDKNLGYIGQRSPHDEAMKFVRNIIVGTTGLDHKDAANLAKRYSFTKRDANFLITNAKDFINVYTDTGRKINIVQNDVTEAGLYKKVIPATKKNIPDNETGKMKEITTVEYTKLIAASKSPKYNK